MNIKQEYLALGVTLLVETCIIDLLCGAALQVPGMGTLSFLVAGAIVFYYSARHPAPFGIAAGLFNALLLAYFSQSQALPTALLLLLVTGVSPFIEQLAPKVARITFAGAYAVVVLLLGVLTRGDAIPDAGTLVIFVAAAMAAGLAGSRYLIRRSPLEQPLEQYHG